MVDFKGRTKGCRRHTPAISAGRLCHVRGRSRNHTSVPDIRSLDTADSASAVPTSILQMSSSRLATQVFSSSLRCRAGNFQGTAGSLPWAFARGFQQSAVSRKTVQKLQQKPPANDDETLKAMDTLQALAHKTNMDVWSQPIETLGK